MLFKFLHCFLNTKLDWNLVNLALWFKDDETMNISFWQKDHTKKSSNKSWSILIERIQIATISSSTEFATTARSFRVLRLLAFLVCIRKNVNVRTKDDACIRVRTSWFATFLARARSLDKNLASADLVPRGA